MIFILWIVSRCAFHNASSQLIFISKIDVGQHLQGIAQVFRPEFRHFLSEPSGIYIRLVGMYVQVPLKNSKTCCHRITDIKQATL